MSASPHRVLSFGVFTLDLIRCVVLRGDEELALRRQSFDVLRHLAEHAGATVSKEELRQAVWPTTNVTLDSVVQCIKDIRQALGEDARWIIRTVSGRGYVFMAEVTAATAAAPTSTISAEPSSPVETSLDIQQGDSVPESGSRPAPALLIQWRRPLVAAGLLITALVAGGWLIWQQARHEPPAALSMMAMPTVAVLPFEALGSDPAEARALFDDVMTELSLSARGNMISIRSSTALRGAGADLKALGRQLGARYLVLGSLRREGGILHINIRFIEAETERQVSSQPLQYAQGARNYAAARIARIASARVIAVESRRPLPPSPEAAHYTILADAAQRNGRDAAANKEVLALLEKAIDLDPNWVPALLDYALAQIFEVQSGWAPGHEHAVRLSKAEDALERVFKLTPGAPGRIRADFRRGLLMRARGDPEGAITVLEGVLARHPYYTNAHASLGGAKIDVGRAHEAIAHIEEAIRLGPTDANLHLWYFRAGIAAVHTGEYETALQWLKKAREAKSHRVYAAPWLAVAYAGLGREDEGRALLSEHLRNGHRLTISEWNRRYPLGSGVLAEQRARIVAMLERLGVPEGKMQTGAMQ